ncbi:MAG: hypothetical protein PHI85_06605 [Victivallaceae bacterium]|nr:hypothetical protein [Victivallaceae bacterium]
MPALKAALDMSGIAAAFALARGDGSVICRTRKPMRQREAAGLAGFLTESLSCAGCELPDIAEWTVGSGPGSFTGMRLAAALVAGLSRGREVKVRCVPTAVAIADTLVIPSGSLETVLFDGRNHEIIAYELKRGDAGSCPLHSSAVLNAGQTAEYFSAHAGSVFITQQHELDAVLRLVPERVELKVVEEFDPAALIFADCQDFDNVFSRLEYIRPAVFPKKAE